nr:MAG TPA: hypothetical protein [Caudoviricetes sp.]
MARSNCCRFERTQQPSEDWGSSWRSSKYIT